MLHQTASEMIQLKRYDHAEAAIKGYLKHHGKDAQPWMYEWLVACIDARKGDGPWQRLKAHERQGRQADARLQAAFLAKRTKKA